MVERCEDPKTDKKDIPSEGPQVFGGVKSPSLRQKITNQGVEVGKTRIPWLGFPWWSSG